MYIDIDHMYDLDGLSPSVKIKSLVPNHLPRPRHTDLFHKDAMEITQTHTQIQKHTNTHLAQVASPTCG